MLETSIFSISHNVFYPSQNKFQFFQLHLSSACVFKLGQTKILSFGKELNVAVIMISLFNRVENTKGNGENASFQHYLLFATMFSKASFLRLVKSQDCVVKS